MTLLTIATEAAKDVGLEVPDAVAASGEREHEELVSYIAAAANEAARRVNWGILTTSYQLAGDGTELVHALPADLHKLTDGVNVKTSGGSIVRAISRAEWDTLTAVEGTPRYYLLEGQQIRFWPYLANAATVTLFYQSKNWCSNGSAVWSADTETSLIPEDLILKGTIARWRRQKGMPYQDQEAEYEAALSDYAAFDNGGRP